MTTPLSKAGLRGLLIDLDGVIYTGKTAIPGAADFVRAAQARQLPFLFLTNNSTLTPEQYVEKLAAIDIQIAPAAVFTSALATAHWLAARAAAGTRVLAVGESGLYQALKQAGFERVDDWRRAAWVVGALDRRATWESLKVAALAIRNGARFVATNADLTLPSEEGELPGTGSIMAFLTAATGVVPTVIGKPETPIFEQALRALGSEAAHTAMIGDRYETDIAGAQAAGLQTIAVLSGISDAQTFAAADPPPDWVFNSIADIGRALFV